MFLQQNSQYFCCGRLSGTAQSGKPNAESLFVASRIRFDKDLGDLGTGKPLRQRPPIPQV
jgi:hypothetical protein